MRHPGEDNMITLIIDHLFLILPALLIGAWIGAAVGILVIGLCQASANADRQFHIQDVEKGYGKEYLP